MLLGYEQLSEDIAALKYGQEMEGEAREQYIKIQEKNWSTRKSNISRLLYG